MFLNIDDVAERVRRPYQSDAGLDPRHLAPTRRRDHERYVDRHQVRRRDARLARATDRGPARPFVRLCRRPLDVVFSIASGPGWSSFPIDATLLLAPILWSPELFKAFVCMAALSIFLLSDGRRYRARLHLSVLDELPTLIAELLTAAAVVATVIALRHDQDSVTTFLSDVIVSVGLVVLGRVLTTRLIRWSRARGTTVHRTVIVGGGPLAAELAQILLAHPALRPRACRLRRRRRGGIAQAVIPRIGSLDDLDRASRASTPTWCSSLTAASPSGACSTSCALRRRGRCDLLVVPRMHHFATQTGARRPHRIHPGDTHPHAEPAGRRLGGQARASTSSLRSLVLVLTRRWLLCALARPDRRRPGVIFRQARVGRHGVVFDCLKLRSMRPADEAGVGHDLVGPQTTAGSGLSGGSSAAPRSTNCRSCGTSSAAT